jgi:aspartokinase/homoserine dehydrogenase 1
MVELASTTVAERRRKSDVRLAAGVIGRGNVGGELLKLWPETLRLVAAINRSSTLDATALLDAISGFPRAVLVDVSAADGMESLYARALSRGVHVVTANKKPLVATLHAREALFGHDAQLRYETTVGAGLPVIEPLKDLVRTGDEVRSIEGSFSGTLGFLCGELSRGVPLSRAVKTAKELGYTEPHPREDLGGLDVARKALILAREAGLPLELGDVEVEPFIPARFLDEIDICRFMDSLSALDDELCERVRQQAAQGRVLRYLAQVDVAARSLKVAPRWVDAAHPAAQLKGTESFVTFTTRRYSDYPMRIQGPGAGAQVTAAGVLADVLAVQRST